MEDKGNYPACQGTSIDHRSCKKNKKTASTSFHAGGSAVIQNYSYKKDQQSEVLEVISEMPKVDTSNMTNWLIKGYVFLWIAGIHLEEENNIVILTLTSLIKISKD